MELQHGDYSREGERKRKEKTIFLFLSMRCILIKPNSTSDLLHQRLPKGLTEVSPAALSEDLSATYSGIKQNINCLEMEHFAPQVDGDSQISSPAEQ